jgi:CHAT domain-containing protein
MYRLAPLRRFLPMVLSLCVAAAALLETGQAQPAGKKHALLIGVRKYDSSKFDALQYTENDVDELEKLLSGKAGFTSVRVLSSTRGESRAADAPTAENIRAAIKALLARKKRDDTVLVALAGHGMQATIKVGGRDRDESFFCPADAQFNDNSTLISLPALFADLDGCGAGVKLLLVDACRNDPAAGRNVNVDGLRPPRGIAALFSCKGGERAFETDKLGEKGHGVFFHYVLEGLRGKAKNSDGEVTWSVLADYVTRNVGRTVPRLRGGGAKQTPCLLANLEGESPILIGPEKAVAIDPGLSDKTHSQCEMGLRCARDGEPGKAAEHFDRAQRLIHQHLARPVPKTELFRSVLSQQRDRARKDLATALSLALAEKGPTVAAQSAAWLINAKALDHHALASGMGKETAAPAWVELDEVRKGLPADAVLIDIGQFEVTDFKGVRGKERQTKHYAAWITPAAGPVKVVDLGPADALDAAVEKLRDRLQGAHKRITDKGEIEAEKELRQPLEALSKRLLGPLLPHAGKAKSWLVSPAGSLWLLPWEALLLPGGKYAVEPHPISYLTTGQELAPATALVKPSAPLVLADPDFDLKLGTERSPLGQARRLPSTAAEARAIEPFLKAYAGSAPRLFLGARAREGVVKAARSPRVLVLCTHAYFLPEPKGKPGAKGESPLARCGVLLAGHNHPARDGEDGVLTGLEVAALDLRGTDLVVLSADDTGVGEVQGDATVVCLRQAFRLAGARSVVSALSQVPDTASARLMALFFAHLSKGQSKAEALRAAKLKLIEERRDDFGVAHPFFWAAFTLTGR